MPKPTPEQLVAIETMGQHLCVDAGAGCGKTHVLVERVMHLLREGVPLHRIVAITFTRKAAAEMKERLRSAIHRAADPTSPTSMDKWRNLEYQVETARITTIDSFCMGVLREHAIRMDLDPEFTILADAETTLLSNDTVVTCLERLLDRRDEAAERLIEEYGMRRVRELLVNALGQPAAYEWALGEYARFDRNALIEHWEARAATLWDRRRQSLPGGPDVATFIKELRALEGFCKEPAHAREITRRDLLSLLEKLRDTDQPGEIARYIALLSGYKAPRGGPRTGWMSKEASDRVASLRDALRDFFDDYVSPLRDTWVEERAAERTLDVLRVYRSVRDAWASAKAGHVAMDFGDLLAGMTRLLKSQPEARRTLASEIDYLLIDEFQDTNTAQLEMARALMRTSGKTGAELFVVGDAKQSIYRFRGADVEVFHKAQEITAKTLSLSENFRSKQEILSFVHDVFVQSRLLHRVSPEMRELTAARGPGADDHITFLIPEERDGKPDANADRRNEAKLLAMYLNTICGENGIRIADPDDDRKTVAASYGDVAVLFRARAPIGIYEDALLDAGIPVRVAEGAGFFKRQEIIDFRNLLVAATDPWNEPVLAATLRGPFCAVSDDALYALSQRDPDGVGGLALGFHNKVDVPSAEDALALAETRNLLEAIWARREGSLPTLFRWILERTGIEAVLLAQFNGVQKASNVRKLVEVAEQFSHTARPSLVGFADYLTTLIDRELQEGDAELLAESSGAVTLMTIHKAKGLEFPITVVADMGSETGGKKSSGPIEAIEDCGLAARVDKDDGESALSKMGDVLRRMQKDADTEEEARILYVAMTRARDRLVLSGRPNATRGTWMGTLDALFGLRHRSDGDAISGSKWSGKVVRQADAAMRIPVDAAQTLPLPPYEELMEQTKAFTWDASCDGSMPVSTLLDLVFPDSAHDGAGDPVLPLDVLPPTTRGNLVHDFLEQWTPDAVPAIESIVQRANLSRKLQQKAVAELRHLASVLEVSALSELFRASDRIERELPFSLALGGREVQGKIDVLLGGHTLIDYKTGERTRDKQVRYEGQLRLYATALAEIRGTAPSHGYLYYTDSNELVEIDIGAERRAETLALVGELRGVPVH